MFRKIILFALISFFLGFISLAYAEDISVTAEVDTHTVQAGSPVFLTITVNGTQSAEPVELPEIKGFQPRFLGPRTHIAIMNGKSNSSISFVYNLYALEVGHFQIPAISMTMDNKIYTTAPIVIEVVAQATSNSGTLGQENQASANDKVFLVLSVPTKEYFVNEKIPLSIRLYVSETEHINLASNIDFNRKGFDIDEIVDSKRGKQILGSENFAVIEFKTFIYPQRPGELTLGPAQLLCKILVKDSSQRQSPFPDMPSVFGDDLFSGFFDQWRDLIVKSTDIAMKVLPLPDEGKPKNFSGGVGKFNFDVSVSPTELKVGDPITLRMKVSGDGSLKNINFPQLNDPHFKFYEPQVREADGEKILEQVVIPTTHEVKEFSAVSFSYFDPEKRQYLTITKGPFPLKLTKADNPPAQMIGGSPETPQAAPPAKTPEEEKFGQGVSFIKDNPGTFRPVGAYLYKNPVFLSLVFIFIVLWTAAFVVYRIALKFKTDTVFARRFLAPRKAKKELAQARHQLEKGDQKEFYDRLSKTLQEYFASKSHQKSAAMTVEASENLLKKKGFKPEIIIDVKRVLEEAEMVRFASAQMPKEQMQSSLLKVEEIIDHLERNWA